MARLVGNLGCLLLISVAGCSHPRATVTRSENGLITHYEANFQPDEMTVVRAADGSETVTVKKPHVTAWGRIETAAEYVKDILTSAVNSSGVTFEE